MEAFTLVRKPSPIPQNFTFRYGEMGMTILPSAIPLRTKSTGTPSSLATVFISSVMIPRFASSRIVISHRCAK